jgi:FMN phosphatase YigB (HAD superfamily)
VQPDQVIHVGDNPEHDVLAARDVGMHTIWMNSQAEEWPGGEKADQEIDKIEQLPGAIASITASGQ